MAKGKPYFVLALLVILAAALVGCDGELGVYTVSGTVWEEDSGNPLAGAAVTLGEQRTVTNAREMCIRDRHIPPYLLRQPG